MMPWIAATTENSIAANFGPPSEERDRTEVLAHRPSEKKRVPDPTKRYNHHRRIGAVCCPELGEFIQ